MLNFYNFYLNSYRTSKISNRYDSHKRSELKQVCNSITSINQNSPLYIINLSDEVQQYAINLKENARQLKNVISSIVEDEDKDTSKMFTQKEAVSDNPDIISVRYIGNDSEDYSTQLTVEVANLASPQINVGNYVASATRSLSTGQYAIDINTGSSSYEFRFSINDNDTNASVMHRFVNSINKADIGIKCSYEKDPANPDRERIILASTATGAFDNNEPLFTLSDLPNQNKSEFVDFLGLNNIHTYSSNSHFVINDVPRTSSSNTFTVNKTFELTLYKTTQPDMPVNISFKTNKSAISDKLHEFIDSYNNIIAYTNTSSNTAKSSKLLSDIGSIAQCYKSELDHMGLNVNADSSITIDEDALSNYIDSEEESNGTFASFRSFRNPLSRKLDNVIYNPMDYVAKTIVTYPNTRHPLHNIYTTSMYSGLMFNNYC